MFKTLLLVTWLIYQQPPSTYHVEFDSLTACFAAKDGLFREAARLGAEHEAHTAKIRATPGGAAYIPFPPPQVAAVCIAK